MDCVADIVSLADLYAVKHHHERVSLFGVTALDVDNARTKLGEAIDSLVAERDTLAAGVRDLVGCSAVRLDGRHVIQGAIAVAERIKAASEPATAPAVPAALAEPNDKQVMLRVGGKSFRCDCGCNVFTELRPGMKGFSCEECQCNACGARYRGAPKSAEPAEPAKPSPLAGKVAEMRKEVVHLEQAAGLGWPPQRSIITSILAIASVVEVLAKEAKR